MGVVSNFSKKFDDKVIFDNYAVHFPSTGICFLLGKSGVGKTTMLRSIAGLDKDYDGNIAEFGRISMMFQEYRLFPWISAIDNVLAAFGDKPLNEQILLTTSLLSELGFSTDEMHLKPGQLSGGMKQRVSFARAILAKGDTVILDEPFKELDAGIVDIMYNIIRRESREKLFLIVTHDEIPEDVISSSCIIHIGANGEIE